MRKRGFTLVEMIVVVSIIAILVAIGAPRLIGVSNAQEAKTDAARQVLTMLKAARIYAGTNAVDAGVAYSVSTRVDNKTGATVDVIDGAVIVRRLRPQDFVFSGPDEQERFFYGVNDVGGLAGSETTSGRRLLPFVPVKSMDGHFKPLKAPAVIAPYDPAYDPDEGRVEPFLRELDAWAERAGLCPVRILDVEAQEDIAPRPGCAFQPEAADYTKKRFPAHVFKPSGVLQVPSGMENSRALVSVTPAPDAEASDRWTAEGKRAPVELISLYTSTGQVVVEEPPVLPDAN